MAGNSTKVSVEIVVHDRSKEAATAIYDAILAATQQTFEENVLPDAKQMSPYGPLPERPGVAHNRDSLQIKVFGTKKGPFAKLFSTSGHGGFLEVGTKKMSAQPYAWPAFQMNLGKLQQAIRAKLAAIKKPGSDKPAAELGRVLPSEE